MADNFEIRYLESDHILNLYTQIYGSDKAHFCIRPDKLDIILNEIKNDDLYPSFVAKLTSLFCGILQNHLFFGWEQSNVNSNRFLVSTSQWL